jgi:hypothetical protein
MAKTKFFRVATSGATTDGRTIDEKVLRDLAETYDPKTYQARVNLEHIKGIHPDSTFGVYGDVLALKAEPVTLNVGGRNEDRLALYAQIDAMDNLVNLQQRNQKLFTSIEVRPNFAGSGRAYLDGLAFTDNPASLGTEMMKFCAGVGEASPLHFRKADTGNIIAAAEPVTLEFDATPAGAPGPDPDPQTNAIMDALRRVFGNFSAAPEKPAGVTPPPAPATDPALIAAFADLRTVIEPLAATATAQTAQLAALTAECAALKTGTEQLRTELTAAQAEQTALRAALAKIPTGKIPTGKTPGAQFTTRPQSTGGCGDQALKTDC